MMEVDITYNIIGAAIEVHKSLGGPGLLESVYEEALCHELMLQGFKVQRQVYIPVLYKGAKIKEPLSLDIVVDDKVVVEVKATEKKHAVHEAQLLTYLRLSKKKLGLLINFGSARVNDGISRVVNEF